MRFLRGINRYLILFGFLGVLGIYSCINSEADYVPKPKGYPYISFPQKIYRVFDTTIAPYTFQIPQYALMEKDTLGNYTPEPSWFNLNFKPYNATLHITYYSFTKYSYFDSLVFDTRKFAFKHQQRAEDIIEEPIIGKAKNVKGMAYYIQGNTASNFNFYLTDSAKHFLRGALYFNYRTNQDSIRPVYQFIQQDVRKLIESFSWKY